MATVLIIDNDTYLRKLLMMNLKEYAFKTIGVKSGLEALKKLRNNHKIDIILLDQMMPSMDGLETFDRINAEIHNPPPVIMVTGFGTLHLAVEFLKKGGKDFVLKPIDIEILVLKIHNVLYNVTKDKDINKIKQSNIELSILLDTAAALAHEINNPLSIIFQAIEFTQGVAEDVQYINMIREASLRIRDVIKDLNNIKEIKIKSFGSNLDIIDIKKSAE
ncbi:MAG: response regulator [Nitrospirae bacterium]|nr:response regulator [Nitrospirota bacterium]